MTYKQCYENGVSILETAQVPEARLDARLLLEAVCGTDRNALLVHGDREVTKEQETAFMEVIGRRAKRIPLQHILGYQEFMGFRFQVNEHVLIPRQDTEVLVEKALEALAGLKRLKKSESRTAQESIDACSEKIRVLDMCTGSGCILISLLKMCSGATGIGVDISRDALTVAKANGEALLKEGQVSWICSDMFANVEGKFDVITSNPPYIPTKVIEGLMPEVKEFEPMGALDGMEDGLFFYRKIALEASRFLKEQGHLFLEIGHDQGEAVSKLLLEQGFTNVQVLKDYAGLDRVVSAQK